MPTCLSMASGCARRICTTARCLRCAICWRRRRPVPKTFYRGYDVYDRKKAGFVSDVAAENGKKYFLYDTALPGNGNGGHLYGTHLSPAEKDALVEYMKKL